MHEVRLNLIVRQHARLLCGAEHQWHVGTVDVRVDESNAKAEFGQRDREIDGDSCFADTSLA